MSTGQIRKIAICGGGLGGLALAAVLNKNCDIHVDIYEAKPVIATIGAGIAIWKRTWQVLQELGLEAEMTKRKLRLPQEGENRGPTFRKADQPEDGFDFHSQMLPYGPSAIARPILLEMLQAICTDKTTVYTSKRLVEYRSPSGSNGPIELVFEDGTTASADLVIGADGVHSPTRATMYRSLHASDPQAGYDKFIDPIWSGTYAYRAQVDALKLRAQYPEHRALDNPRLWLGKSKHVVSHPLGNVIHLTCYDTVDTGEGTPYDGPWVKDVLPEEVTNAYEGWEPDLTLLLKHLEKPSCWAIHVVQPLPLAVVGRVGLLGDAAHAMTPHQGVGGGQAIEDAHLLGHLLAHPKANLDNIGELLRVYQDIRLPFAAKSAERSRENGLIYEFIHPDYPVNADAREEDLKVLGKAIGASFEWLAQGGCDEDRTRAEHLFEASLV